MNYKHPPLKVLSHGINPFLLDYKLYAIRCGFTLYQEENKNKISSRSIYIIFYFKILL